MSVGDTFGVGFTGLTEPEKLRRAAQELESVVIGQLLGAMRRTVPEGGLFEKSAANDIFQSLLDTELARATAEKSPFGLAEALERSLADRFKETPPATESENAGFRRVG
jgi:flagellar protein FlgJ